MKTAKLTYSKVAGLLQNLVKKGVNILHPLIADEGAKVIEEYAKQQAIEFANWSLDIDIEAILKGKAYDNLTDKQLYQKFKEEQK